MHRYFVILLIAVAATAQDTTRMAELVKAQAAGDRFMGSALVAKDGATIFEQSAGWANAEWKLPHTPTTKFRIGSVSKQFTAAAILLLEERGRLSVDDLFSKYVPSAPDAWQAVTLRHLLTHTSGIPNFTALPDYNTRKASPQTPAQMMALLRDKPLEFTPGEKFNYSNSGYVLLGWIVELASGQGYDKFLREQILQPLGMKDSGYDSNTALLPQRAAGYSPGPGGLVNADYIDMHVPGGAGGIYSTPADLVRWTQGLFSGKLLSAASLEKMTTPFKGNYAFGLGITTVKGRKLISHSGGIDGFSSYLAYYPETKLTVVVLSNVVGGVPTELADQLATVAFGETVTLRNERHEIALSAEVLQRYVGVYQLNPRVTNTIRLTDGHLTTQLTGQPALPLFAESEKKFFLKIVDAQVEFVTDEQGKVTQLLQSQRGRTQTAPRVAEAVTAP